MLNRIVISILLLICISGGWVFFSDRDARTRVAHAAGGISGDTYTNSLEALNLNYEKGFRLFEIDFNWTSDGALVCLHDWQKSFERYFGRSVKEPLEKKIFIMLAGSVAKYRLLTLDELVNWLDQHPGARIVTDVKSQNIKALKIISEKMGHDLGRVIPQIYCPSEYQTAIEMGYKKIIWTLYLDRRFDEDIVKDVAKMNLFAVTMPVERAKRGLGKQFEALGVATYVHTINNNKEAERYIQSLGITEVYTDFLPPN